MRTTLRGFVGGFEELFPRPKRSPEAAKEEVPEKIEDLLAGIQAAFGKDAAEDAVAKVAETFPRQPEDRSPAVDYLNTSLLNLATQYDTDDIIAALRTTAQTKT